METMQAQKLSQEALCKREQKGREAEKPTNLRSLNYNFARKSVFHERNLSKI